MKSAMLVDKTRSKPKLKHISHSGSQVQRKSHHQSQISESTQVSEVISEVIFGLRGNSHFSNHFGMEVEVTVEVSHASRQNTQSKNL